MKCLKLLLCTAVLVTPLLAAPSSQAGKRMEVMVQDDGIFRQDLGYYDRHAAFQQLRRLGATRLRVNLYWSDAMAPEQRVARSKPRVINYDWSQWDTAIAFARAYGIKVQLAIGGRSPAWATGNKRPPGGERIHNRDHKPKAKAFGQFARVAARHFGRRVDRYSIWNEPNWYSWLSPHKRAPRLYRNLYRAGYRGIKRGNKRAKVFMGETAPGDRRKIVKGTARFLREAFCVNRRFKRIRGAKRKCKGGALRLDGYAHHPYSFTTRPGKRPKSRDDVTMGSLGKLTSTLDRLQRMRLLRPRGKRTQVFLTEHGYFVSGARRQPAGRHARWTVNAFKIARRNRRVKSMLYYGLVSPPAGSPWSSFDTGLIANTGVPTRTFNRLRTWVTNARKRGGVAKPRRCQPVVRALC